MFNNNKQPKKLINIIMKKIAIIVGIIIVSSSLFSCGGASTCVSSEKYIPTHFNQINDLDIVADSSDIIELDA